MLDFGWGAYHPMYDVANVPPQTNVPAEAVAQFTDSEPPRPEPQSAIGRERAYRNHTHYFNSLEQVRKRGICRCRYKAAITKKSIRDSCRALVAIIREDDEAYVPYHGWTAGELKKSLKQRNLQVPRKKTLGALRKALKDADTIWEFRLMDLPSEVRLRCYEMILLSPLKQTEDRVGSQLYKMPALLHTTSQVRREASPVFYRTNYIEIQLLATKYSLQANKPRSEHPSDISRYPRTWLLTSESIDLTHLRLVSFNCQDRHIEMDLCSDDTSKWVVRSAYGMLHTFSCPKHRERTLGVWFAEYTAKGRADRAASVVKLIADGKATMHEFRQICDQKVYVQPTHTALQHLAARLLELFGKGRVEDYPDYPFSDGETEAETENDEFITLCTE